MAAWLILYLLFAKNAFIILRLSIIVLCLKLEEKQLSDQLPSMHIKQVNCSFKMKICRYSSVELMFGYTTTRLITSALAYAITFLLLHVTYSRRMSHVAKQ